jgi:small-conductance mechanosensitive channel
VEHIGLKTTRLRSLSGEQLVFSNSDLLQSRIRNYKRMYERRVVFGFGVVYQTSYEKLEKIPKIVRAIIEAIDQVRFDRAHFKEYGNFSLNFEVVYWVKSPDYNLYMDIQQSINLAIYRQFEENKIAFAFPTQTIFVSNNQEVVQSKEQQANQDVSNGNKSK